jgi:MATE family multidrug resistance protein
MLLLFRQDPEIAALSGLYVNYLTPSILPVLYLRATERFLNCQRILFPGVLVGIIALVLNIIFNYFFIFICNFGFIGAPLATTTSRYLQLFMLWFYIYWKGIHKRSCDKIYKESFQLKQIWEYLKLGFPSAIWLWLESMGWNIVTILVGTLQVETTTAAHAIAISVLTLSFITPLGIGVGTSTRVGNLIGERRPNKAKFTSIVSISFISTIMIIQSVCIAIFGKYLATIWNSDPEVIAVTSNLFFFTGIIAFQDAFQTVCTAILRGIGKPGIGTIGNLCYWFIGVPIGILFDHVFHLDVFSYWWGLLIALTFICVFLIVYIAIKVNWKEEVERSIERMKITETEKEDAQHLLENEDLENISLSKENSDEILDYDTDELLSSDNKENLE